MEKRNRAKEKNEIDRLRRENSFLRSQLRSADTKEATLLHDSKSYFAYLWKALKGHSAYKLFERASSFFSRFRLISHAIKISAFILIAVQTSAVLLIAVTAVSFILPPIILVLSLQLICSVARYPTDGKVLRELTAKKRIVLLFPTRQTELGASGFTGRNALELATRGYAVIVVSPFFLSSKGLSGSLRPYINLRVESDGITIIRRQYFFFIKKQILQKHNERVIFIY